MTIVVVEVEDDHDFDDLIYHYNGNEYDRGGFLKTCC